MSETEQKLSTALVTDDAMSPRLDKGDVVYFDPDEFMPDLSGADCVVETSDGDLLVRFAVLQPSGCSTLIAHKRAPLHNVRILSLARVAWQAVAGAHPIPVGTQILTQRPKM